MVYYIYRLSYNNKIKVIRQATATECEHNTYLIEQFWFVYELFFVILSKMFFLAMYGMGRVKWWMNMVKQKGTTGMWRGAALDLQRETATKAMTI